MDQTVCLSHAEQCVPSDNTFRQRVFQGIKIHGLEQGGDYFVDGPTGQLGSCRVDGDGHGGELLRIHGTLGFRVLVQQKEVGVGQAEGPAVAGHLSREHGPTTRQ
ncbi:hypothetical protein D3C73_1307110 [compost metagenome]